MTALLARPAHQEGSTHAEELQKRLQSLLESNIDFIPNASFTAGDDESFRVDESLLGDNHDSTPRDLPGHLARLCETRMLTPQEEMQLFRWMNYLKHRAHEVRETLRGGPVDEASVTQVESYLAEAKLVRDRIIKANMRLAISVVKKFVTPQQSFDDLLSEGIYSLMQAAEKFDYDRGFRFSTYAYRVIARNSYRKIADQQKQQARFGYASEESAAELAADGDISATRDDSWERLREVLSHFLDRLDRRERFIVRSRYALGAHRKVRTFQYLADKLGVSKERVRQIEKRAVGKLQAYALEEGVDDIATTAFG